MDIKNKINFLILKIKSFLLIFISCLISYSILPKEIHALNTNTGKSLFENHCAGCHLNGGNIIRRSKNLKVRSLKRDGINDPEAIAKIAREGIGIMGGYKDELGVNGDKIVANWVWEQAQKAWVQE